MKLNLKSLLKDKNVLYIVLFIAVANLFGFLMLRQFDAIILFLLVGFLSTYFSKNMIIILLVAILSTNFLIGTKLIVQLGYEAIYNTANPFDFMELISIEGKTNFFEKRVGEYALATKTKDSTVFDLDGAF